MFPFDILHAICTFNDTGDLLVMALSSTLLNEVATPLLYADISLSHGPSMESCMKTLSSPAAMLAFRRDLAKYPRTIVFRLPAKAQNARFSPDSIARDLWRALPRLVNLRELSCNVALPHVAKVLVSLSGHTLKRLELVTRPSHEGNYQLEDEHNANATTLEKPQSLALTCLRLDMHLDSTLPYIPFIKHILAHQPDSLRSLSLTLSVDWGNESIADVFERLPPFANLKQLSIGVGGLRYPCFSHAPRLTSLCVIDFTNPVTYATPPVDSIPHTAFSALQKLSCLPSLLAIFLPAETELSLRRPIDTLEVNHATYARNGGNYSGYPIWEVAATDNALQYTAFSGVAITSLSVFLDAGIVRSLPLVAPGCLAGLENLLIILCGSPQFCVDHLGSVLLAHMPHLRTFLLSDASMKSTNPDAAFEWAQERELQKRLILKFEEYSGYLTRVAFTTEFEWRKKDGKWREWSGEAQY